MGGVSSTASAAQRPNFFERGLLRFEHVAAPARELALVVALLNLGAHAIDIDSRRRR